MRTRKATLSLSPLEKLFRYISGWEDPLTNGSACIELPATAESAGASARYHAQDGRLPVLAIFCALLASLKLSLILAYICLEESIFVSFKSAVMESYRHSLQN